MSHRTRHRSSDVEVCAITAVLQANGRSVDLMILTVNEVRCTENRGGLCNARLSVLGQDCAGVNLADSRALGAR